MSMVKAIRWIRPAAIGVAIVLFGYTLVYAEAADLSSVLNRTFAGATLVMLGTLSSVLLIVGSIVPDAYRALQWGFTFGAGVGFSRALYFVLDTNTETVWSVVAVGGGILCSWYALLLTLELVDD